MGAPPSHSAVNNKNHNNSNKNDISSTKSTSKPTGASESLSSGNTTAKESSTMMQQQQQQQQQLSTYLSLIQQHLAVFMVDNATFLAERCVASYPSCSEARYLLALCYYRGGSPERARQILDHDNNSTAASMSSNSTTATSRLNNNNNANNNTIQQQMRYLSAQCSFDMKDYRRAEDALLKDCRLQYQRQVQQQRNNSDTGSATSNANAMDEWIVQTTPCPIPNGAAGLALLGKICRKSNRRDRAVRYFRMSLQLDPFLWTSFVSLSELGDDEIRPENVFGVQADCYGDGSNGNIHNNNWLQNQQNMQPNVGDRFALHQKPGVLQQQHHGAAAATAAAAATPLQPSSFLATPLAASAAAAAVPTHHHQQPPPSFDRYHPAQPPPPQSAAAAAAPVSLSSSAVAATNAYAGPPRNRYVELQTPGLTPIPMDRRSNNSSMISASMSSTNISFHVPTVTQQQLDSGGVGGPGAAAANASSLFATPPPCPPSYPSQTSFPAPPGSAAAFLSAAPPSSAASSAVGRTMITSPHYPAVLKRARDVASRQYYPPSPETAAGAATPVTSVTRSMRYLRGLGTTTAPGTAPGATATTSATLVGRAKKSNAENHNDNAGEGRSLFTNSGGTGNDNPATPASSLAAAAVGAGGTAGGSTLASSNPTGPATSSEDDHNKDEKPDGGDKVNGILQLLSLMGAAYQQLCKYQCRNALQLLKALPARQQNTGWVLHQQGRAFLELNDFANSQRCLELLQQVDPGRVQGLELLSTVYWHLKKETELAYLSQRVVDMDRLSPEAWCVVGNCFSLQKDHESALVFFQRSLQLDPDFTYTHTLSGYEYMANESFDKAIACFRQALRIDERHYNAWYGLGAIYHRQEKFDLAEYHFERAVIINPSSSVLRCNLGIAQHANGKSYQALDTLAGAFQLDPRNPQARFQRATIYSSLQRHEEALMELRMVRDAAPREATIHFAMGKVLKRLGKPGEAMKCFMTALDLDPKDNQMIKSAMDKLDEPEIDEETMAGF